MIAASLCWKGVGRFGKAAKGLGLVRDCFGVHSVSYQQCRLRTLLQVLNCGRLSGNKFVVFGHVHLALLTMSFRVRDYATDSSKILSTDDLGAEDEVTDEVLKKLMSAINSDPDASKQIGSIYVEKLCKAGKFTALAKLLQVLCENKISLSQNDYNILLSAAGDANNVELLFRVLENMLASEAVESTSYADITKPFIKMHPSSSLVTFVQDLSDLTPTIGVTLLNKIIYSLAGCGQVNKALLIYHTMKRLTCKPDLVSYNTVLGILGRTGRVDEMLHEFSCMKENSIVPDLISFNTLINSLKKVGRLDLCLKYLKEMTENGLKADLRTYTALIESFGRLGNVEEPVRLLEEMKVMGVCPSIYVYRSLIDNLKKAGMVEESAKYSEEMKTTYEYLVGPKDFKRKRR